jgi:hypothetical protein
MEVVQPDITSGLVENASNAIIHAVLVIYQDLKIASAVMHQGLESLGITALQEQVNV